jgi:hypothetical protein
MAGSPMRLRGDVGGAGAAMPGRCFMARRISSATSPHVAPRAWRRRAASPTIPAERSATRSHLLLAARREGQHAQHHEQAGSGLWHGHHGDASRGKHCRLRDQRGVHRRTRRGVLVNRV